jgi:hypothetical protein
LAVIVETKATSSIALVSHLDWNGNTNTSTTSTSINTTGATLLVMSIGQYIAIEETAPVPSDSYGNTWTLAVRYDNPPNGATENQAEYLFYAANPTVGTGHTFTTTVSQGYTSQQVAAFSGIVTSSPLDQTSGVYSGTTGGGTLQPGSLTPSQNDCLIITNEGNFSGGTGATASVNLGFTITNQDISTYGSFCGSALAYLVQATAAAINPTWTLSTTANQYDFMANMAVFKGVVQTDADTVNWSYVRGSEIIETGSATDVCTAGVIRKAAINEGIFAAGFSASALSSQAPGTSDGVYSYARDTAHIGQVSSGIILETGDATDVQSGDFDPTLGMFLLAP